MNDNTKITELFWSAKSGKFVDQYTGNCPYPGTFTGTIREWYETLVETMYTAQIIAVRENGGANIDNTTWQCDSIVKTMAESSVLCKAYDDGNRHPVGTIGDEGPSIIGNVPLYASFPLYKTGLMHLVQNFGKDNEKLLCVINVLDIFKRD